MQVTISFGSARLPFTILDRNFKCEIAVLRQEVDGATASVIVLNAGDSRRFPTTVCVVFSYLGSDGKHCRLR